MEWLISTEDRAGLGAQQFDPSRKPLFKPNPPLRIDVAVTYRREWQGGYGARGWKLDVPIPLATLLGGADAGNQCAPVPVHGCSPNALA